MQKLKKLVWRVAKDEEGTALIEYSILLGVIAVVCVAAAIAVGNWSGSKWQALCTALSISCGSGG
jgi:pilus assembly protein Flp/PilA